MTEEDDLLREFLAESRDGLDQMEQDLLVMEREPAGRGAIDRIFRAVHTLKGTCGFLNLRAVEAIAHAAETLLDGVREGRLTMTAPAIATLLRAVDALRQSLRGLAEEGVEPARDDTELLQQLARLAVATSPPALPPMAPAAALPTPAAGSEVGGGTQASAPTVDVETSAPEATIRVDVLLLDKLMNLVGELVLARNQVLQLAAGQSDAAFAATSQRLSLITTELQEGVMKTRMQPIGNVWAKFPRMVRDLCLELGKAVRLEMEGRETELDKTLIEAIKDPLTHLLRNALDHGLETPTERDARGKPREGAVSLRAYHEGGQVNIEIADDGRGIDVVRVRERAVARGLLTAERAASLGERESLDLIFAPGFSTAEAVTHVSGRGVGMDVVRTNIERIGGSVDVLTRVGAGTTIKIKIPLTLAIVPALVVACGGERFAMPQVSLLKLVRLEGKQAAGAVEWIHDTPVYRLRGSLLPLVDLHAILGVERGGEPEVLNIVVLQAGDRPFGVVVDAIHDTQEIVVKPLGRQLNGLSLYSGATIMGDGRVALILDALGLAQLGNVLSEVRQKAIAAATQVREEDEVTEKLLLFRGPDDARLALPITEVARLEEFPVSAIQRAGGADVVRYRGEILPLVRLAAVLEERRRTPRTSRPAPADDTRLPVIVHHAVNGSVGLVVEAIDDIVEAPLRGRRAALRRGSAGTVLVRDQATELIDLAWVVRAAGHGPVDAPSSRREER